VEAGHEADDGDEGEQRGGGAGPEDRLEAVEQRSAESPIAFEPGAMPAFRNRISTPVTTSVISP
jgi:hypothetical protein